MDLGLLAFTDWICISLKNPDHDKNTKAHITDVVKEQEKSSFQNTNTTD